MYSECQGTQCWEVKCVCPPGPTATVTCFGYCYHLPYNIGPKQPIATARFILKPFRYPVLAAIDMALYPWFSAVAVKNLGPGVRRLGV